MTYDEAFALLRKYNSEPFHITHALTVSNVMRRMADELGYGDEADFWAVVGLLHDLDFERWPEQHCIKGQELMREAGLDESIIRATASHGYGITVDIRPEREMEKVLYATDELTGLIGAVALMRPSKSVSDMEVKSVRKKYKDRKFAAGCSREVIERVIAEVSAEEGVELNIPIGTMLELPRACMVADEIAQHADFFCFGTNDLTQTTFGFSRDDAEAKFIPLYMHKKILKDNPFETIDSAVLELVRMAVEKGRATNPDMHFGVCGEHGGDPKSIKGLFNVADVDYVSCSPYRVPLARLAAAQAKLEAKRNA